MTASGRWQELDRVFQEAVELPASERQEFLVRRCGDDTALLREASSLVAAHATSVWRWDSTRGDPEADRPKARELEPGTRLGRYEVVRKIGEGGMGTVYEARQESPARPVAIKVLKHSVHSEESLLRFAEERQTLAMMDHPAIAAVFDAGSMGTGTPYFVMQLVSGVPITAYCDLSELTIRQRLELFARACDGVEHAHHKTVVHRDLKPSNVLVSGPREAADVKIIDFGLAKALEQETRAFETRHGRILGTPAYMSPEQLLAREVDIRSDVYSLGVMLYELLVGCLPIDPTAPGERQFAGVLRLVGAEDLVSPSERLERSSDPRGLAALRQCAPASHRRQLRPALDQIALKALARAPDMRYRSSGELAADIRSHLAGRPVSTNTRSMWSRAKQLIHRGLGTA